MEYIGLLTFFFVTGVVANIAMGIYDLKLKKDVRDNFDYLMVSMQEDDEVKPIALSQSQVNAIADVIMKMIEENDKKDKED